MPTTLETLLTDMDILRCLHNNLPHLPQESPFYRLHILHDKSYHLHWNNTPIGEQNELRLDKFGITRLYSTWTFTIRSWIGCPVKLWLEWNGLNAY